MKHEIVKNEVGLWAVPRDPAYVEPGELPYTFEICMYTASHWKKGAICVNSMEIEMVVPEHINFQQRAIETLENAIQQVQADAAKEVATLKMQLNNLLCITHQQDVDDYQGADHD